MLVQTVKRLLPEPLRRPLREARRRWRARLLPLWRVRSFDRLRRVTPLSRDWGYDRGQPIDRYYIERFLAKHGSDVRGRVLEIVDATYTRRFGDGRVTRSDVLDLNPANPAATIVDDLAVGDHIPSGAFDCIICTQTLLLIYDVRAAVRTLQRALRPGGVVLATVPGVAHQICRYDMDRWGDYWRFTSRSIRRLFEEAFPMERVEVTVAGNVLAATAFLHGLAAEELTKGELEYVDPDYELSLCVRAVKPERSG